jgi:hypothetical protein
MRTAVSPPNKGSDDIKPGEQTHASGTGHHMKSAAKKCNELVFLRFFKNSFSLQGFELKVPGKNNSSCFYLINPKIPLSN